MKKIIKSYRLWRYRRLHHKLFFLYASKDALAYNAKTQADEAFIYLTDKDFNEFR